VNKNFNFDNFLFSIWEKNEDEHIGPMVLRKLGSQVFDSQDDLWIGLD